jgi:uncharacterized coiled-coil protein SlyX
MKNLEGCLIRYGGNKKKLGSFILINPNSNEPTGCLFTGLLSEVSINLPANLLLDLDNAQVSTLFRYFCYQFWNKAEKERIGKEERDTEKAPVDIYPPSDDSCDPDHLKYVWNEETKDALVYTSLLDKSSYMEFSNFSNSKITSLLLGINSDLVRSLKQKNNEIRVYDDVASLNSLKIHDDTWLIPKIGIASEEIYSIQLNPSQKETLEKHISTLFQGKAHYEYVESDIRGNLNGKTIIYLDDSRKVTINDQSTNNLGEILFSELLPKDDFENYKPESKFVDDLESVSITYKWTNIPYTLPSGSKKHQLYTNWENAEKDITAYIDRIQDNISDIEKSRNKFSKLIVGLLLGKSQKFSEYKNELDKLKSEKYSTLKNPELREKIKQINEICISVKKESSELNEENRKAKIKEDIDAKETRKKELNEELVKKEMELKETEEKIKTLSDGLKDMEKQSKEKTAEKEIKNKEMEDKKVAKKRIEGDIDKLRNKIKNITNDISNLNTQLKNPAKEEKNESSTLSNLKSGGKTPNQSGPINELSVPQFPHLPHTNTGELFQHNGQAYLAITDWEDYDKGKKETERLKAEGLDAKLCAKGENNG